MLPSNKTKIVCTIGPKCESPEIMLQMLRAGMNVARNPTGLGLALTTAARTLE